MDSFANATSMSSQEPTHNRGTAPLKIFGVELPLPPWAVNVVAAIVILALPAFLFVSFRFQELAQANEQLKEARSKLANSNEIYVEETKHHNEPREEYHRDPNLIVTHYRSDGCITITRIHGKESNVAWYKAHTAEQGDIAPGPIDGGTQGNISSPYGASAEVGMSVGTVPQQRSTFEPRLLDASIRSSPAELLPPPTVKLASYFGCINPHPGKFISSNGRVQGCWTQVWRKWPDGCTHYQWFNSCSSTWDADSHGKPRVYWTACVH